MSQTKRHSETDGTPDKNAALPLSTDDGPQRENNHNQANAPDSTQLQSEAYDQDLLERVRTQWQFGDWKSLAKLQPENIENHPERVKLALLTAAGHLQLKDLNKARAFIKLAKQWGGDKRLISRILIGGVYNTLGKAAAIAKKDDCAIKHFMRAVQDIGGDAQLNSQARHVHEIASLGLFNQASKLVEKEIKLLSEKPYTNKIKQQIYVLRTELELLHQELSLAQQRKQLTSTRPPSSDFITQDHASSLDSLKNKSVSQLGQDIWVLEKLNYKKGGFFVEFGATDGVLLSNTYMLEKEFDWQGICAEPNPKLYTQLQKNRSCISKNTCIAGSDNEERDFILADAYGSLASYEGCDKHKQKRQAYRETGEVIKVTTQTLDSFLKSCNAPQEIDYLSIDTEGSELEILQEFDFNYWQVKLLTVEHNFQAEPRQKIRELLARYGYQVQEAQWDDWFWRSDLIRHSNARLEPKYSIKIDSKTQAMRANLLESFISKSKGILHLGGHLAQEAPKYHQLNKPVIWIEAIPSVYSELIQNIQHFPEQHAFCALLDKTDGLKRQFKISNNMGGVSSSIFDFDEYGNGKESLWPELNLHMVSEIPLTTVRLDSLLKSKSINSYNYDFWVIDLQGAELLALQGGILALKRCNAMLVEVSLLPIYKGGVQWDELREWLAHKGFIPLWDPKLPHDDVLFIHSRIFERINEL